jgi:cytochrome b
MTQEFQTVKTRIWDLPTRLFHILLALCVLGLVITGDNGDFAMAVHFYLGYTVLTLLAFRIIWGVVGGHWSRFMSFVPSPSSLLSYLRNFKNPDAKPSVGHNPLGAISVFVFLIVLTLQGLSGLMSDDDVSISGPWTVLVPNSWVEFATEYHTEIGFPLILVLIGLHIAAVFYHLLAKKQNLIRPMLDGDKLASPATPASRDSWQTRLIALAVVAACAYGVYRLVTLSAAA